MVDRAAEGAPVRETSLSPEGEAVGGGRAVRFEGLEAYRGIAALLLVVFHAYQYTREGTGRYAYEGTPLGALFGSLQLSGWFFVLSGFLISRSPNAFPQNALIIVALSIAVAGLSYRFLERPAAALLRRFSG